jgi:hypothetical protein
MRRHRSAAGPLAVVYLLLVAYASLYPFERWSLAGRSRCRPVAGAALAALA